LLKGRSSKLANLVLHHLSTDVLPLGPLRVLLQRLPEHLLEPLSPRHRLRVSFRRRCSLMAYRPNPLRGIERLAPRLIHVVPILRFESVNFPVESSPCGMGIRARPLTLSRELVNELLWLVEDNRSRISRHIAPSGGASPKQSLGTS